MSLPDPPVRRGYHHQQEPHCRGRTGRPGNDLGPSTDELQDVTKNGFMVAIRPTNYCERYTAAAASEEEQINAFFRRLDDSGAKVSLIIGSGKQMLGNNKYLPLVAKNLLQRHITMGMVEGVTQLQFVKLEGMTELARLANYQVARTYVIADAEQRKMQVFDAFRRWSLADEERNIRVNYIKTFLTPRDNKTLLQTNLDYVDRGDQGCGQQGLCHGAGGYLQGIPAQPAVVHSHGLLPGRRLVPVFPAFGGTP